MLSIENVGRCKVLMAFGLETTAQKIIPIAFKRSCYWVHGQFEARFGLHTCFEVVLVEAHLQEDLTHVARGTWQIVIDLSLTKMHCLLIIELQRLSCSLYLRNYQWKSFTLAP